MDVARWMTKQVHTVKPRDTIAHARELMERHRVNQLPVVARNEVVGIVTDRDLRDAFPSVFTQPSRRSKRVSTDDPTQVWIELVMTPDPFTLGPRDDIARAAELMRTQRIGALPVVDEGRLVGVLTRSDLLRALIALCDEGTRGGG